MGGVALQRPPERHQRRLHVLRARLLAQPLEHRLERHRQPGREQLRQQRTPAVARDRRRRRERKREAPDPRDAPSGPSPSPKSRHAIMQEQPLGTMSGRAARSERRRRRREAGREALPPIGQCRGGRGGPARAPLGPRSRRPDTGRKGAGHGPRGRARECGRTALKAPTPPPGPERRILTRPPPAAARRPSSPRPPARRAGSPRARPRRPPRCRARSSAGRSC